MLRMLVSLVLLFVPLASCDHCFTKYRSPFPDETVRTDKKEPVRDFRLNRTTERIQVAPIVISPSVVRTGTRIFLKLAYTVFGSDRSKSYPMTQIVSVAGQGVNLELLRRRVEKNPGTYTSYLRITLPKDGEPGHYTITNRFVTGGGEASAKGTFKVQSHSRYSRSRSIMQAKN